MYRYRFTGTEPEDHPYPPVARRLHPGDVVESEEPIEHARLELLPEPKASKAAVKED